MKFEFHQENILAGLWDSHIYSDVPVSENRVTTTYELELVLENGGTAYINGTPYPIIKYTFLCIRPGTVRHSEYPFKCLYIKFNTKSAMLIELLAQIDEYVPLSDGEKVYTLFTELLKLYHSENSELLICARFAELLHILSNECAISGNRAMTAVAEAKKFMSAHLEEKLTLEDVATWVHFNPIYFHRIFKREVGVTPLDYLTEQRIEKAKRVLCTTATSVAHIALECGFSTPNYFGSIFKKHTGYTPLVFRKTHGYQYLHSGRYPEMEENGETEENEEKPSQ